MSNLIQPLAEALLAARRPDGTLTAAEARTLTIYFSMLPPVEGSPNRAGGHWATRMQAFDAWKFVARTELHRQFSRERWATFPLRPPVTAVVNIYIERRHWRRQDKDNWHARCKPLWDLLVAEGVLMDDRSEWLTVDRLELTGAEQDGLAVHLESGQIERELK